MVSCKRYGRFSYLFRWSQNLHCRSYIRTVSFRVDDDGKVRVVISEIDSGVQNWLDTSGLPEGVCSYRSVRARTDRPHRPW